MSPRWFVLEAIFWKLWPYLFFGRLIILLTDPILSHSPNFGRPKHGQKFVVPTFHIHFLNPEWVRIPWVAAPKIFLVKIFGYGPFYPKNHFFANLRVPLVKRYSRSCALNFGAPKSEHKFGFITKPQLPSMQQTDAKTNLNINTSNSNYLNKFWVIIFTRQGQVN